MSTLFHSYVYTYNRPSMSSRTNISLACWYRKTSGRRFPVAFFNRDSWLTLIYMWKKSPAGLMMFSLKCKCNARKKLRFQSSEKGPKAIWHSRTQKSHSAGGLYFLYYYYCACVLMCKCHRLYKLVYIKKLSLSINYIVACGWYFNSFPAHSIESSYFDWIQVRLTSESVMFPETRKWLAPSCVTPHG